MKKRNSLLIIAVFIFSIIIFNPITCKAWEVEHTSVSNIVVREGQLTSFDFHFEVPDYLGTTQSWLGIQGVKFNDGDFKDNGNIYGRYANISELKRDDDFLFDYKILQFTEESFSCFGEDYSSITKTLSDLRINSDENNTYYVYLWTQYGGSFYPDALLATVKFENGTVKITDPSETQIVDDTFENLEAPVVDKIEIVGANFNLTVGKEPTFSAKLKDETDKFNLVETFMSLDRSSRFNNIEPEEGEDALVKDLKYFHISDIYIKDNVNLKFDENTKVYLNGVEQSKDNMYISNYWISISDESKPIIPEGYIAPVYLDEAFEKEQQAAFEKAVLQLIKEGKVTYNSDEVKEAVKNALENNDSISIELYISEAIAKSLRKQNFEDEVLDAISDSIKDNYKISSYYNIAVVVYINDMFVGYINELDVPLSITVPYPNGIPSLDEGYQRVWKIVRYHDGKVDILDANKTDNGINFLNDKYSAFALIYEDTKINEPQTNNEETNEQQEKEAEEVINNPKTIDNIILYIVILLLSIIGLIVTGLFIKKSFNK